MDVSGSTEYGTGTGCAPILDCEQKFINALNQAVIDEGSVDQVSVVAYASSAASGDMSPDSGDQMLIAPDADSYVSTVVDSTFSVPGGNGGLKKYTEKLIGYETNCTDALEKALEVANTSSNDTNMAVFVSDGLCDDSGGGGMSAFNAAIQALADAEVVVHTIAAGTGSSCDDSEPGFAGTLQMIADGTGGKCYENSDPGDLPDLIPNLIGSTLESLEINGTPIPNSEITPNLPLPGAASVTYTTTAADLVPADHTISVTAYGSDVTGGTGYVTQEETIHLLQLTASPEDAINDLNDETTHTVEAKIIGGTGPARDIDFEVSGQNAGTASPANDSVNTSPKDTVKFT
ncbi:MAG: VWA domain-containing protein, partial [Candidatus Electrothrix sp. ATG2]|nr:VWA domain-containing protein [Candidatus Electrothrix sp. ATG2]